MGRTILPMVVARFKSIFSDCYVFREVFYNLFARDFKIKYRRTVFGYVWSLLNPILQLALLSFVFSHIVRYETDNYVLYLFSGFVPWLFFQSTLLTSAYSYIENENFIKKVYLPKLIFPLTKISLRAVDFVFSLVALSLIGMVLGLPFKISVICLPLAIIPLALFTLGMSILVAMGTVFFRDVEYFLGIFLQALYFATPILYPSQAIPDKYRWFIELNPMYTQIRLFQDIIYSGVFPSLETWVAGWTVALGSFALGIGAIYFFEDELAFRM